MQRSRPPGTPISVKFNSGTSVQPMPPRGRGRKFASQVGRDREQRRRDVVGENAVALHDRRAAAARSRRESPRRVAFDRDRAANPAHHAHSSPSAGRRGSPIARSAATCARVGSSRTSPGRSSPSATGPKRKRIRLDQTGWPTASNMPTHLPVAAFVNREVDDRAAPAARDDAQLRRGRAGRRRAATPEPTRAISSGARAAADVAR